MNVPDLQTLKSLIALCRKQGVKTLKMGELHLELGDEPVKARNRKTARYTEEAQPSMPSPEEMLFWSAGLPTSPEAEGA